MRERASMLLGCAIMVTVCAVSPAAAGAPLAARIEIDAGRELGSANRRLLGVCVYQTGLTEAAARACRSFLQGAAVRVWVRDKPEWQATYVPFVRAVQPSLVIGFTDKSWHPEKARYRSAADNNLFPYQLPQAVVEIVRCGIDSGAPLTHYALWNEPWHAVNGGWEADDYARYVKDCSRALRAAFPRLKIAAFIHAGRPTWNERFLSRLAPDDVDALLDHFYFGLHRPDASLGAYGTVGLAARLAEQVREDRRLVDRFGKGRWKLICTEWNVHPPSYDPPYEPTRNLAAALFQASMLQAFQREGLDAATLFLLHSKRHFSLIGDADGSVRWPTFHVFDLYGNHYRGVRLALHVESPGFVHWLTNQPESRMESPLVEATACRHADGDIVALVVNKRVEGPVDVGFAFHGFAPRRAVAETLSSDSPTSVRATLLRRSVLPPVAGERWRVSLPAFSFTALRFSAKGDPFGPEMLTNGDVQQRRDGRPQAWRSQQSVGADGECLYLAEGENRFLRVRKSNWKGLVAWQQTAPVRGGARLRLQGRARGAGGEVYLFFHDVRDKSLSHISRQVGAESWQGFTLDATAPATAVSVSVQLRRQKPPGTTDFDDLGLRSLTTAAATSQG